MILLTMKKLRTIVLLLGLVSILFITLKTGFAADPDFPQWRIGNYWKYNIEFTIDDINFIGTQTFTVINDDVNIFQNGQNFNCYQIALLGNGTIYGEIEGSGIAGTWTVTEEHYYTKSDMSWVKIHSNYEETISAYDNSGITTISTIQNKIISKILLDVVYDPPFEANKGFPLSSGKNWSAATTESVKRETTINGNTESTTESEAYTKTFSVLRKESITVSIGEVETYVIQRTDPDGAHAEIYYSPEIGTDIKQIEYDSTGKISSSMELLSYEYFSTEDEFNLFTTGIFLILIIALIIISVTLTIYFLKKKKRAFNSETMLETTIDLGCIGSRLRLIPGISVDFSLGLNFNFQNQKMAEFI